MGSDKLRFKPACSATETSLNYENWLVVSLDMILSNKRITESLIRLRGCAGWSAPLLFATPEGRGPYNDRSNAVFLLLILFVIYVSCLSLLGCIVYFLQPCVQMLSKADLLAFFCRIFPCFVFFLFVVFLFVCFLFLFLLLFFCRFHISLVSRVR